MKNYNGSVGKIESFSTVDGPKIRSVVFLTGCQLRCLYCHNPEFLKKTENNISSEELAEKLLRNKYYFRNGGGVTFSGGEPLLQSDFIIETSKILKKENIHIALDTAGVGKYNKEIFNYIDLVILDIKASNINLFEKITSTNRLQETIEFLKETTERNIPVWIRQVIIPGINDTKENIIELNNFLKPYKNIKKVELLPYHKIGIEKYKDLNIPYKLEGIDYLDPKIIEELNKYIKL